MFNHLKLKRKRTFVRAAGGGISFLLACGSNADHDSLGVADAGIDAAAPVDAFVAPACDSPSERLRWSYQSAGPDHIRSVAVIGDADGDNVPDVAATTDHINMAIQGVPKNYLIAISGASSGAGKLIWESAPAPSMERRSSGWGDSSLERTHDLNGDGVADVLFAGAWNNDSVHAVSGVDGSTLWTFDTAADGETGWIYDVDSFPDQTGDGVPEALFAAGQDNNRVYLADGASGAILWRFTGATDPIQAVAWIPDIDGDGAPEAVYATSRPNSGTPDWEVTAVSGGVRDDDGQIVYDGLSELIWRYRTGETNWTLDVINRTSGGDDVGVSGDPDVIVGVWDGTVRRVSAATGKEYWISKISSITVARVVRVGDLDGDGSDDVAVTSDTGAITALSGETGNELWRGEATASTWSVDRIDDLNRDGVDEIVSASADSVVRVYDGASGEILWQYDTGDERVLTVRGGPDLTGDGVSDVIAGTQYRGTGSGGGTVFVLEGCP